MADIWGNEPSDVHGNPADRDVHGNRADRDITGNSPSNNPYGYGPPDGSGDRSGGGGGGGGGGAGGDGGACCVGGREQIQCALGDSIATLSLFAAIALSAILAALELSR